MKQTVKTSRAAGQLEKMFRELNKHYFAGKLPEPIISLKKTPSAYGHIPAPRSGRQAARTSTRSIFRRLRLTVPSKKLPQHCFTRWCTSTTLRIRSRTRPIMESTTTSASRNRLKFTVWWWNITTSTAGPSRARPKSCWTSSSSKAGRISRWANGWHGRIWQAPARAVRHPAAVRRAHPNRPKPRAAPGGGYAPSAAPSSGAPRKCGSSVRIAWSCS